MLNKLIAFSVKNKLIIMLFVIALVGYGSYQFTKLPIDAVPDITDNQVQVITVVPSLGAPDIERLITFPIEQANSNIPGLKKIRSFSRFGLSLITMVFEDDVDIYWARQQVTERLKIAEQQIPKGLGTSELAPVTSGLGEIFQYVLKAKKGFENKYDPTELRTLQDWLVRKQLLGVKGVADVSSFGGLVKQYEIAIDINKLNAYNLTISDVFSAIETNNENTGGAYIEKQASVLYIRTEGLIKNIDDINSIVVKNLNNGVPLLINNIAEVRKGNATRYGALSYNDEGEVAGGIVMMLKGENSKSVIEEVKNKITQIQKNLPEGVELEPFLDRSKMVDKAISTVFTNLLEGALIVIFVLVLFLGNFRAGLIVASVIPLSMCFAVILMNVFGVSGNLMSLGALDFGLIVDGAVIIVEAVMHRLYANKQKSQFSQNEMDVEVENSAGKMMNSAIFGQIIILIVYLPIFALEGIEGKMFKPMAQTVAFALLGAFILSLTYVPMISALALNKKINFKKNLSDKIMDYLIKIHQTYLTKVLRFPKTVMAFTVSLFVLALLIFSQMGGEFIPELPEGDFAVETRVLTGSNLKTSTEAIKKSSRLLLDKFPEIIKIVGKTGSGEIPTDPMPMEASDLMIILKDKSEWTSASSWNELSEKMSEALKDIPGVAYSFQYPVSMRFNELMTGAKQDVVCKIYGENLDVLSSYSKKLGEIVAKTNGAQEVYVEPIDGLPQLIIKYNRSAMAQYGLNVQEINNVVNTALAGQTSGLVYEDEKRFDLVVRLKNEQRSSIADVQNLLISTGNSNKQIPLGRVADVSVKESISQIQREDAKRRIMVGFNVGERDVQSIVNELQQKVEAELNLPSGYFITYGGAFENLQAAKKRLGFAVPISLLLIFILLFFAFRSVKHGLLIFSAIPLSAIGGILFLALRGLPFSISAGIGFIALFGVAVLNGIVLVAEFNQIKKNGETNLLNVVLLGTKTRLRPVLMTAFVASLGFLPMAMSNGAGAEVQRPLATVVIGGLLLATFLTLFVLPVLYVLFEKIYVNKMKKKSVVLSLVFVCFLCSNVAQSQTKVTLAQATEIALNNNLTIKNEKLIAAYQKQLIKAAVAIPQANATAEYGQINTSLNDTRFGIVQNISFPTVYAKEKALQTEYYKQSEIGVLLKEAEIKMQVEQLYNTLVVLNEKEKLLVKNDSLFQLFAQKAAARFNYGESTILEKVTADTQKGQVLMQLTQLKNEIILKNLEFQLLLNATEPVAVIFEKFKMDFDVNFDYLAIENHPQLQFLTQGINANSKDVKLQKAKFLPDLSFGYYNMSIAGPGIQNEINDQSNRFGSFQLGIGIPIFFGSQKAKLNAAKTNLEKSKNQLNLASNILKTDYYMALEKYKTVLSTISYFENDALKNAELIENTANLQFQKGMINYLEWVLLINNSITIQNNYIDLVATYNQSIIQLHYLTSK